MKKGLSPLIAVVLLVGFTIILAALIIRWGSDIIQTIEEETSKESFKELACVQTAKIDIKDACILDYVDETPNRFKAYIENNEKINIDGFIFKMYGNEGSSLNRTDEPLPSYNEKWFKINFSEEIGVPYKMEAMPIIHYDDEEVVCEARKGGATAFLYNCEVFDDFEDGDANDGNPVDWEEVSDFANCNFDASSREYEFTVRPEEQEDEHSCIAYLGFKYYDQRIEAYIKADPTKAMWVSLVARHFENPEDPDDIKSYNFVLDYEDGTTWFAKRTEWHKKRTLGEEIEYPPGFLDEFYHVKFELKGNELKGYINGILVNRYIDNGEIGGPFYDFEGDVGLQTYSDEGYEEFYVYYDNVRITDIGDRE